MTTPSKNLAKIVAGTFVPDSPGKAKDHPVIAWAQNECRAGSLRPAVESFAKDQPEFLDPLLVLVESVGMNYIECVIPVRVFDHESTGTFLSEVRFKIDPATLHATRS